MPVTPLRRQYLEIKRQYPDVLLLFRLGDFYETFEEDATVAARVLGITLTSREMGKGQRYPMAGIPYHALNTYLGKLINAGHKVAICEQTSDPADGPGLVERGVSRVVTPGTVIEPDLLQQKANNYLAAVVIEGNEVGLAHVDITTGEFATTQLPVERLALELERLSPAETVFPKGTELPVALGARSGLNAVPFELSEAAERLERHFGVSTLEAFGCAGLPLAVRAAGGVLAYVGETQKAALRQIGSLSTYSTEAFMLLDAQTRRNLELLQGGRWGSAEHSLLTSLDATKTSMGGRLLRRWLGQPLLDVTALDERLDAVEWFVERAMIRGRIVSIVNRMADLERVIGRVQSGAASPKEVVALRHSLELVPELRIVLTAPDLDARPLGHIVVALRPCTEAVHLIATALADDPPTVLAEGGVIRQGFNAELDQLREAGRDARTFLAGLEKRERERSGIKSLKVGYNRVFGYYIEISNANKEQIPGDYVRKQTLTSGERYITPELKEYEALILNAQERTAELEGTLFKQVCQQVAWSAVDIVSTAQTAAHLDVYTALAEVAIRYHYTRPVLTTGDELIIVNGRHPVVERNLSLGTFVPNDTQLSNREAQLIMLTGPNMAGKSTYLRQVGVIVLLAQLGSFVPADSARIGVVDRIFTRVGLQDDLAAGQSTFMVEMVETAHILNNATPRSLIILDEIGRGTSTYDGLSIARAVAEHIHNHPKLGAKTLFATHYHELTELANYLPRVRNYHVAVAEEKGEVAFLHKIVPGGADKSYGVHVAQLAGLPKPVVARAREVLTTLEKDGGAKWRNGKATEVAPTIQMQLFAGPSPAVEELLKLDVSSLTPLEAITKLFELQEKARGHGTQP